MYCCHLQKLVKNGNISCKVHRGWRNNSKGKMCAGAYLLYRVSPDIGKPTVSLNCRLPSMVRVAFLLWLV